MRPKASAVINILYLMLLTVIPILVLVRMVRLIFILDRAFSRSSVFPLSSPEMSKFVEISCTIEMATSLYLLF